MPRVVEASQQRPWTYPCTRAMEVVPFFLMGLDALHAKHAIYKKMNRVEELLRINGAYVTDELFDTRLGAPRFYKALRDRLKELVLELELAGAKHQQTEAAFEKAGDDFDKAFPAP
tara:strand:- start:125 stop:472 length:348 start_codon:yes stop_codon:yes gene_type:complete